MSDYQQPKRSEISGSLDPQLSDDNKPLPVPPDDAEPVPVNISPKPKEQAPMIVEEEGEERT